MELVDVYGDQGLSGLIAEKRPELQRMLADARDGKIDLIIVKINGRTEADHRWRELSNSI